MKNPLKCTFTAMQWETCFSEQSIAQPRQSDGVRTHYQRDFDRLIFSSQFRRLQSKTQVFPLPGSKFVHNRLTHSLETASVGRSLGAMAGDFIARDLVSDASDEVKRFYNTHLSDVVASACLAHDVGNPAFGHSGEKAISSYFISMADFQINGESLRSHYSDKEWSDLIAFEGNANALRQLTKQFSGKSAGGVGLTITTLASILKYPCAAASTDRNHLHRKKYGYFQSEAQQFDHITSALGFNKDESGDGICFRHPFVYLVEAADDICYSIMDLEDAHRLQILSKSIVSELMLSAYKQMAPDQYAYTSNKYQSIGDDNESLAYLRAKLINAFSEGCYEVWKAHHRDLLSGQYPQSLMDTLAENAPAIKDIEKISLESIYRHRDVLEIEVAGYNLMHKLLCHYIPAALTQDRTSKHKTLLRLVPQQYLGEINADNPYERTMCILDHISNMTDVFATEHYRKLEGIDIGS